MIHYVNIKQTCTTVKLTRSSDIAEILCICSHYAFWGIQGHWFCYGTNRKSAWDFILVKIILTYILCCFPPYKLMVCQAEQNVTGAGVW